MAVPNPRDLPTIVLVVFDTARRDRFGCYGYGRPTTPTVDSLGARRHTLRRDGGERPVDAAEPRVAVHRPVPHPARLAVAHGAEAPPRVGPTMAQWLAGLGYDTWCVTNNGMIGERTTLSRGFDTYAFRLDIERGRAGGCAGRARSCSAGTPVARS